MSEDGPAGVIVSLPKTSLVSYLRSSGVGVRPVPNWLARWSAKLGLPALYLDRAGQLRGRWGVEEAASALGVQVSSARGTITPREGWGVSRTLVRWAARAHAVLRACLKLVGFDRSGQLAARANDGQT